MPTAPRVLRPPKRQRPPERRPNSSQRGYNWRWRKASASWLKQQFSMGNVYCALCGGILDGSRSNIHVDHRTPPASVGVPGSAAYEQAFWDTSNWQPAHPRCNARKGNRVSRYMVTIVTGPPGAGKTTYVQQHSRRGDLVYDLDAIAGALGAFEHYSTRPPDVATLVLEWRDVLVQRLNQNRIERDAWIIVTDGQQAQDVAEACGGTVVSIDRTHQDSAGRDVKWSATNG